MTLKTVHTPLLRYNRQKFNKNYGFKGIITKIGQDFTGKTKQYYLFESNCYYSITV